MEKKFQILILACRRVKNEMIFGCRPETDTHRYFIHSFHFIHSYVSTMTSQCLKYSLFPHKRKRATQANGTCCHQWEFHTPEVHCTQSSTMSKILCCVCRYLPLDANIEHPNSPDLSKSYGNYTPISHVLICLLNSNFTLFERILLGIISFELSKTHL